MYHAVAHRAERRDARPVGHPRGLRRADGAARRPGLHPGRPRPSWPAPGGRAARCPARPVLITFDDGYEGVHRHALPVLAKHGFAATLFVSTGWLAGTYDNGGALDTMLDWDQVRELAARASEIGGHSHTHPAAGPARRRRGCGTS